MSPSIYESVVLAAAAHAEVYGGVDGVGETVLKHPRQLLIGEHGFHALYLFLHRLGMEQTFRFCRTAAFIVALTGVGLHIVRHADTASGCMSRKSH